MERGAPAREHSERLLQSLEIAEAPVEPVAAAFVGARTIAGGIESLGCEPLAELHDLPLDRSLGRQVVIQPLHYRLGFRRLHRLTFHRGSIRAVGRLFCALADIRRNTSVAARRALQGEGV